MANTKAEIMGMLKRLNSNTKEEYSIQGSYGKLQLEYANGSATIGFLVNKNTMYDQLYAMNQLLEHEFQVDKKEDPAIHPIGETTNVNEK